MSGCTFPGDRTGVSVPLVRSRRYRGGRDGYADGNLREAPDLAGSPPLPERQDPCVWTPADLKGRVRTISILTHDRICTALQQGRLEIDPLDREAIGPASVDLRLGRQFRIFTEFHRAVDVTEEANYEAVTERIEVNGTFLLLPGQSVLGITRERIRLPEDLCGWLEGRSRFARLGLTIHSTAGFVQPGVNNRQVLEISNVAPIPLTLRPAVRVCQLVLEETRGRATYRGRFQDQMGP